MPALNSWTGNNGLSRLLKLELLSSDVLQAIFPCMGACLYLYRWVRHTVNGNQSVTNAGIEALGQLKTDEKKHKKGKSGYEGTEDDN